MLGYHLLVLRCGGAEGGRLDACSCSTGVEMHALGVGVWLQDVDDGMG